jgi:hypothetical protein
MATQPLGQLLTIQPIQPKLILINKMPSGSRNLALLALLLALIFLGAQLQMHFCADLNCAPTGTHLCPICSTVGAAVVTHSPTIAIVSLVLPIEVFAYAVVSSPEIPRATSPRAPPAI